MLSESSGNSAESSQRVACLWMQWEAGPKGRQTHTWCACWMPQETLTHLVCLLNASGISNTAFDVLSPGGNGSRMLNISHKAHKLSTFVTKRLRILVTSLRHHPSGGILCYRNPTSILLPNIFQNGGRFEESSVFGVWAGRSLQPVSVCGSLMFHWRWQEAWVSLQVKDTSIYLSGARRK